MATSVHTAKVFPDTALQTVSVEENKILKGEESPTIRLIIGATNASDTNKLKRRDCSNVLLGCPLLVLVPIATYC